MVPRPAKAATWPKYNYYLADEKFQDIARMLGLPSSTPEEAVDLWLIEAALRIREAVGIGMNFKAQGVNHKRMVSYNP